MPFAGPFNYDVGYAVSADTAGNVYVTGYVQVDGSTGDALTVKYNSSGVQQWARTFENPAVGVHHDMTFSHALDAGGNLYATGYLGSVGTGLYDYLTLKYDMSGTLEWAQMFDNPAAGSQDDTAYSIALDGLGKHHVVGRSHNGSDQDTVTVRYDSAGAQQWAGTIDNGGHDYGTAMAVGPNGAIVVAGTSDGLGQDYVVAKYVAAESTAPSDPAVDSTSPAASSWLNDNTVQVTWSGAAGRSGRLGPRGLLDLLGPRLRLDTGRGGGCPAHRRSAFDDEPSARRWQRLVFPPAHLRSRGQLHGDGPCRTVLDRRDGAGECLRSRQHDACRGRRVGGRLDLDVLG